MFTNIAVIIIEILKPIEAHFFTLIVMIERLNHGMCALAFVLPPS